MSLFIELNDLMVKYRFRPEKRLGQHFITSEGVIKKIVEAAELSAKDTVLEIGAGTGFLTRELQEKCRAIAVEKDPKLCELLGKELKQENLELVCGDYLKEKIPAYTKAVCFPPYFISKKIVLKLLSERPELCVLVFQSEFAKKLEASPGFKNYSALGVLAQYQYSIKTAARIHAKRFFPKPKGDSCIVVMRRLERKEKAKSGEGFAFFAEELFRHKNKNVSNALADSKKFLPGKTGICKEFMEKAKNSQCWEKKVFHLEVEELVSLYNSLC